MQTKEHTHLLNDLAHDFIVIKCGKEAISLRSAVQLHKPPDPSLKNRIYFFIINVLNP